MAHHELKTWPTYFDAVAEGKKTFEVRRNDRAFQTGDEVTLIRVMYNGPHTYNPETGQRLTFRIGWILQGGQFGIEPQFCVFSLEKEKGNG